MRPIDADALIEFIENRYVITWKNDYEGGIKDACTDILEEISKMPTIEPERKKGRWRRRLVDSGFNADWHCSECGWKTNLEEHGYNFCPNCGADMRGDNHDQSK